MQHECTRFQGKMISSSMAAYCSAEIHKSNPSAVRSPTIANPPATRHLEQSATMRTAADDRRQFDDRPDGCASQPGRHPNARSPVPAPASQCPARRQLAFPGATLRPGDIAQRPRLVKTVGSCRRCQQPCIRLHTRQRVACRPMVDHAVVVLLELRHDLVVIAVNGDEIANRQDDQADQYHCTQRFLPTGFRLQHPFISRTTRPRPYLVETDADQRREQRIHRRHEIGPIDHIASRRQKPRGCQRQRIHAADTPLFTHQPPPANTAGSPHQPELQHQLIAAVCPALQPIARFYAKTMFKSRHTAPVKTPAVRANCRDNNCKMPPDP